MKRIFPYLFGLLILGACVWMFFDRKSGHDQRLDELNAKNKRVEKQLDSAYLVIYNSKKLETDLKAHILVLSEHNRLLVSEAETSNKLYQREKKRKTGILSDSLYTVAIDSLYPGR